MKQLLLFFSFLISISVFSQVANQPYDYYECDNNGYVTFNFTTLDSQVLGGQNPNDYYVTYHPSVYDVENNNVFGGSYTVNINSLPMTVYVRVTDKYTGGYDYTSFNIGAIISNFFNGSALDVIKCDDNVKDGITAFYDSFCCGYNPASIHRTRQDAEQGINPLTIPFYNITPHYDQVYGREENSDGCYKVIELLLYVEENPEILKPTPFVKCDDNVDGFVEFDLEEKDNEIMNGSSYISVTYHLTSSDAASYNYNNQKISKLYTNSTPYIQTIYARATFNPNGCYSITSLDLIVQDCKDLDNDNVINSYEDINGNGNLEDDDTDLDTIPDYLDDDDDGDGILTKNEDYNNNGTPLDDDTNLNNIPDYLEYGVALEVEEFKVAAFKFSPNPAKTNINIEFKNFSYDTIDLIIYDSRGKQILKSKNLVKNNKTQLNVSSLRSGFYFLKVEHDGVETIKKLIIN